MLKQPCLLSILWVRLVTDICPNAGKFYGRPWVSWQSDVDEPLEKLTRDQRLVLLRRLRRKLQSLALSLQAPSTAIGAEVGDFCRILSPSSEISLVHFHHYCNRWLLMPLLKVSVLLSCRLSREISQSRAKQSKSVPAIAMGVHKA